MSNVEPDVRERLVISQGQSTLKAGQGHVILLGIKTAQAKVVEQFRIVHTHL
jgi:hypothetical protein